jgi:GT2 family glycosyltransferase
MSEPIKMLFAVLSTYERSGWVHPSILQFFCDMPFKTGYSFRVIPVHNFIPAASGRNVFCRQAKDTEADWICMLDNDMNVPDNLLDTLKDVPTDASIVVPAFYMWNQAELKLTLCWGMDGAATDGTINKLAPGFYELTKCGTGAIFIKPKVFRELAYPYFKYLHNEDGGLYGTEDIQFCLDALAKGFKIYGNSAIHVGHWHSVDIGTMWDWMATRKSLDIAEKESVESIT